MAINKMMEAELATTTAATDADAQDFYAKNPDKFKQPETVRASHILVKIEKDDTRRRRRSSAPRSMGPEARQGRRGLRRAGQGELGGRQRLPGRRSRVLPARQMVPLFDQAASR